MAEERILIQKIEPECKFRESHETTAGGHTWVDFACGKSKKWKGCEEDDFIHCEKKELIGLSRLDAIERIAEALCRKDSGIKSCHECIHNGTANCGYTLNEWFSEDAEAALNALLEAQNER